MHWCHYCREKTKYKNNTRVQCKMVDTSLNRSGDRTSLAAHYSCQAALSQAQVCASEDASPTAVCIKHSKIKISSKVKLKIKPQSCI